MSAGEIVGTITGAVIGGTVSILTADPRWFILGVQLGYQYGGKKPPSGPVQKEENLADYFEEVTAAHSSGITIPIVFGRTKTKGNIVAGYKETVYINDKDLDPEERDTSNMFVALGRSENRTVLEEARLDKNIVDISVNNWGRDHPDGGGSDFPGSVRSTWEYDQLYATGTQKRHSVDSGWVRFFESSANNILAIKMQNDNHASYFSFFSIYYYRQYPDGRVEKTEITETDFTLDAGYNYWWASVTGTSFWKITFEFDSGDEAMGDDRLLEIKLMDNYSIDGLNWTFTALEVTPTYFQFYPGFPYHAFKLNQTSFDLSSINFEQIIDNEINHPVDHLYNFLTKSWGLGYPEHIIDKDSFDEVKAATPGVEFNADFSTSSTSRDIINALLLPILGILLRSGEKIKLRRDVWSEPVEVFSDGNVVAGTVVVNKSGVRDLKTRFIGTWEDSSEDWLIKEAIYDHHDLQTKHGIISEEVELKGINTLATAQTALEYLARARLIDYMVAFQTSDRYANVEVGDLIILNYSALQLTEVVRAYEIKEADDGGYTIVGVPFFAPISSETKLITTIMDFHDGAVAEGYSIFYEDGAIRIDEGDIPVRDPHEIP